jgi:hypothetical protein
MFKVIDEDANLPLKLKEAARAGQYLEAMEQPTLMTLEKVAALEIPDHEAGFGQHWLRKDFGVLCAVVT